MGIQKKTRPTHRHPEPCHSYRPALRLRTLTRPCSLSTKSNRTRSSLSRTRCWTPRAPDAVVTGVALSPIIIPTLLVRRAIYGPMKCSHKCSHRNCKNETEKEVETDKTDKDADAPKTDRT